MKGTGSSAPRCPRCMRRSGTSRPAAKGSRPNSASARPGRKADATNAGHRPRGTDALRRASRCSRASCGAAWTSAHDILQLIAEAEGASRLIVTAPRPIAGHASVWYTSQPLARTLRDGSGVSTWTAPSVASSTATPLQQPCRAAGRAPKAAHEISGVIAAASDSEPEDDLALLAVRKFEGNLDRGTRIQSRPTLPERRARVRAAGLASCRYARGTRSDRR